MTSKHHDCLYHVTPVRNLAAIAVEGLVPQIGPRSQQAGETDSLVHCFTAFEWVEEALKGDWARRFEESERLTLLAINLSPRGATSVECGYFVTLKPHLLWVVTDDLCRDSDFESIRNRRCVTLSEHMAAFEAKAIPETWR
jgi:hypothetical protein